MDKLEYKDVKESVIAKIDELNASYLIVSILFLFFIFFSLIYLLIYLINRGKASNFKLDKEETKKLLFEEIKHAKIPESLNYKDVFN